MEIGDRLFQRRERCWDEHLVADACDNGSIALAVILDLVPCRVVLKLRPPRLAICQGFPLQYVGQLAAGFPDERGPETKGTNAMLFPDGKQVVSKSGLQLEH